MHYDRRELTRTLAQGSLRTLESRTERALSRIPDSVLRHWLLPLLMEEVREEKREAVLRAERAATYARVADELPPEPNYRSDAEWQPGGEQFPRLVEMAHEEAGRRANLERWRQEKHEIEERYNRKIFAAVSEFKQAVREEMVIEWTQELLSKEVSLPDGTVTTWGEMTADQHQERAGMFTRLAQSNAEGAVRHEKAIEFLASTGRACLNDAVAEAA